MASTPYSVGTITVTNGSTSVAGTDTFWIGSVDVNDMLFIPSQGLMARVTADPTDNEVLAITAWSGTDLTDAAYEIIPAADSTTSSARLRDLLAQMSVIEANGRGLFYRFSDSVTDADPGSGYLRLNNATIGSATAAYFDNLDANGATVSAELDTWDDSTSLTKGTLWLRAIADPSAFHSFKVTGSVVDGTGYRKLTLVYVGGSSTFSADDELMAFFVPTGDRGEGFVTNAEVADPSELTALEGESEGYLVFVTDLQTDFGAYSGRSGVVRLITGPDWELAALYTGTQGIQGVGWTQNFVMAVDGARRVKKLAGYLGGTGTPPTDNVGLYLKGDGTFTATIGDAVDIRGSQGPAGEGFYSQIEEEARTDDYTIVALDAGVMLAFNKATTVTATLPAIGGSANQVYRVVNVGVGNLVVAPDGAELVDGGATLTLATGAAADIWPNATATEWRAFVYAPSDEYLSKNNNLSDLQSPVIARENLGLAWETIYNETRSSVASVDLINLSDYKTLRGTIFIRPSASTSINARFSDTNGASFYAGASDYINSYLYGIASGAYFQEDGSVSQIRVSSTGAVGFGGQDGLKLNFEITRFNEGGAYAWLTYDAFAYTSTSAIAKGNGGGRCEKAVSFDAIRFLPSSGTISFADILLEGHR